MPVPNFFFDPCPNIFLDLVKSRLFLELPRDMLFIISMLFLLELAPAGWGCAG